MVIRATLTAVTAFALGTTAMAATPIGNSNGYAIPGLTGLEQRDYVAPVASDFAPGGNAATPLLADSIGQQRQSAAFVPTARVKASFEGISQYDVASYARNFIPPDTMGAVGTTQFSEFVNGGFAVIGKNGVVQKATSDVAFWAAAGQTGTNGDSRVMFDKSSSRWVALSFGASVADLQIAVSDTADAAGGWKSTKFTGFAGGTADYPTLAIDKNAVYIGTNNFNGDGSFGGTTLNVIPISSLLGAGAPTTTGLKQFVTPYNSNTGGRDGGYAIQGVNSDAAGTTGKVLAASLFKNDLITFDIKNAGTDAAAKVNGRYLGVGNFADPGAARQPNATPDINTISPTSGTYHPSNDRILDTLDPRIGSSVFEQNGLIYSVFTSGGLHNDHSQVNYHVIDAATGKIVGQGSISDGVHDFFQGSLSVNAQGQVVIGYNRSGSGADGNVSFLVRTYSTSASGRLIQRGAEELLKVSVVDDYHNGSIDGFVGVGRQRWGDYSQVSVDPTDSSKFWVIGEFAREYNDGVDHPTGTGGSRWSTWISEIDASKVGSVPEPASWALMIAGFGFVGAMQRRRRVGYMTA